MAEYFEREALLCDISDAEKHGGMGHVVAQTLIRYVKRVPAVDVAPVVHGKWQFVRKTIDGEVFKCSVCGKILIVDNTFSTIKKYLFCYCCGADMRGEEDESY